MNTILKTALFCLVSLVCRTTPKVTQPSEQQIDNHVCSMAEDAPPVLIYAKDVNPGGKIISAAGTYQLAENIVFNPEKPGLAAITIDAANVTLLLNNYTLSQTGTVAPTDGILINGQMAATIEGNGIITGFNGNGIHATAGSETVSLKHLISTANRGPAGNGAYFEHANMLMFYDCDFHENDQSGLTLLDCNIALFQHCASDNNGAARSTSNNAHPSDFMPYDLVILRDGDGN